MNIDEAMKVAACYSGLAPLSQVEVIAITLAAEVKRLREFTEAQRKDNEQLLDRNKMLTKLLDLLGSSE